MQTESCISEKDKKVAAKRKSGWREKSLLEKKKKLTTSADHVSREAATISRFVYRKANINISDVIVLVSAAA